MPKAPSGGLQEKKSGRGRETGFSPSHHKGRGSTGKRGVRVGGGDLVIWNRGSFLLPVSPSGSCDRLQELVLRVSADLVRIRAPRVGWW